MRRQFVFLVILFILLAWLSGCAPAASPAAEVEKQTALEKTAEALDSSAAKPSAAAAPQEPASTAPPANAESQATQQAEAAAPEPAVGAATTMPQPTATAQVTMEIPPATVIPEEAVQTPEGRILELEYPPRLRLGDSDVIRLSLIPSTDGYTVRTEFPDHRTDIQDVQAPRIPGYDLFAVARLEGVGFEVSPTGEQPLLLSEGKEITWHWSLRPIQAGQQRLAVQLMLRWQPQAGFSGALREEQVFSRGLNIQVASFFGLTRTQSLSGGLFGLFFGAAVCLLGLIYQPGAVKAALAFANPNPVLAIEPPAGLRLASEEHTLLSALFRRYGRLVLESEFLSGYSGARTFLARPLHPDGRADAHTIIKIGETQAMSQEFMNYERYVKNTLPPVTARIQQPPVNVRGSRLAAIQYTFIGTASQPPVSLRQALLTNPDPGLLQHLFETFGPNWWMQRRPYTFRLAQEYDRVMPTHLVVEPLSGSGHGHPLDGRSNPGELAFQAGDLVTLQNFSAIERRADGRSLSLQGEAVQANPPLRVRWLGLQNPNGATGRVTATRADLLQAWVDDFPRFNLPDPLLHLAAALREPLTASQSVIHGDLNLENILVGPGGFVWLIDFAMTRDGHTLFDFAHLGASLVAHVIAPQMASAESYLQILNQRPFEGRPASDPLAALLVELSRIAGQCLLNPTQPREFHLALYVSCLGALKYANLGKHQKHLLYLTAAHLNTKLFG